MRHKHRKNRYKEKKNKLWIIIIILIIGYLILNNIYIPYESSFGDNKMGSDYKCNNNKVVSTSYLLPSPESVCNLKCYRNDYKRKIEFSCDNNEPVCICKATLWSIYIKSLF